MQATATIDFDDVPRVVEAIFAIDNPIVSEAYSKFDEDIVIFYSEEELIGNINQERESGNKLLTFSVYYSDTQGFREVRKIALKPGAVDGHKYRYAVSGWGVIQFHLERLSETTFKCYFGVNTEKRANKWIATYPELKSPNLWNWQLVEKHLRKLSRGTTAEPQGQALTFDRSWQESRPDP